MKYKMFGLLIALLLWANVTSAEEGFAPAPEDVGPLLIGQELPELILKTADGEVFDLNVANSKKPLVVVFYRGHW